MHVPKKILLCIFIMCWAVGLRAMVYDNRYFPLYPHIYSRTNEKCTYLTSDAFILLGHNATRDEDTVIGIPEIFGVYDFTKLANAVVLLGNPNPLAPDFTNLTEIIYNMSGAIEAQGFACSFEHRFTDHFWLGGNAFFMHLFSRINFRISDETIRRFVLTNDQVVQLDEIRRQTQAFLGFDAPKFSKVGFSDIDLYARFGKIWEYVYKLRRIDAGGRIGMLINSGLTREINNPASLPFGGDGFFGLYIAGDTEVEVKEDWKVGLNVRISKRFARKVKERIAIANEQPLFGAVVGDVRVSPGFTFIFSPFIRIEDIREGLGGQLVYTAVFHLRDSIKDARANPEPPATLETARRFSDFNAEYFSVYAFYDFARVRKPYWWAPIAQLRWDMPVSVLAAKNVAKTQRISLGLLFSF